MIGEVVGNYRIASELGRGGMGMVYRAEHTQLGRQVALKMLLPQLSTDPTIVQRFFNEARAASAIDHPGIVEVFDFGRHTDGRAFIVMALLKGESLDHRLLHGALPPLEAATLVVQVASVLVAAHACGIIHRDLKPDNIFLVPNELLPFGTQVKLLDFGIAKLADEKAAGFKTQTGALIGTPAYMSPEQCMGRSDIDLRTDLYSLGCILFHVLTGRPPFLSDHGTGVMIAAHMRDPAPHPRSIAPHVPEPLAAIAMKLLEKDPAARYQTAQELRTALVAAGATSTATRPPVQPIDQFAATAIGITPAQSPSRSAPQAFYPTTPAVAAQTTHGQSSVQVLAPPAPPRSRRGLWFAIVTIVVIGGGVATFAAVRGGGEADPPEVAQPTPPTTPPPPPLPAGPLAGAKPIPPTPPPRQVAVAECSENQFASDDTKGHCCWREQAWSTSKSRCVGTPICPEGFVAKSEECIAVPGAALTPPIAPAQQAILLAATPAPKLTLNAKSFKTGADVAIKFAGPVSSRGAHRAWVAIAPVNTPASAYGTWSYVGDGATATSLKVPEKAGEYEVRLHTDYPTKAYNVQQAVRFLVVDAPPVLPPAVGAAVTPPAQQRFSVATTALHTGDKADIRFAAALQALPGEQFWITVVPKGSSDSTWGTYEYVTAGARATRLAMPATAGDYEIRLHANYPKMSTNVVHRVAIHVD